MTMPMSAEKRLVVLGVSFACRYVNEVHTKVALPVEEAQQIPTELTPPSTPVVTRGVRVLAS